MNREVIQFGEYEFMVGDTVQLHDQMQKLKILDITKDSGNIYVILKFGNKSPFLVDARRFAYYIVNNVFQPSMKPKYKIGQHFIHQYNNNTVRILAISPAVAGEGKEFIYFCSLLAEDGSYAIIDVEESYFSRLSEVVVEEEDFLQPPIPVDAVLPEVVMYIKPPEEFASYPPQAPTPPSQTVIVTQPPVTEPTDGTL